MRSGRRALATVMLVMSLVGAACTDGGDDPPAVPGDAASTTTSPATTTEVPGDAGGSARYQATIRRTTYGVAHVVASDWGGLGFGQGYAHAEDHPCDLADQVVRVRGERSRWFGPGDDEENLDSDFALLHLGLAERAPDELAAQPVEVRDMVEGFAAGYSQALTDIGVAELPSWCAGAEWIEPISGADLWAHLRLLGLRASGLAVLDLIAEASPPPETLSTVDDPTAAPDGPLLDDVPMASNGWAIGSDRSAGGGGMLLSNTHFPWEGELRWWESHLTIPGELDVYGASLMGVPGINVGFNRDVAWTHTVSSFGRRFTGYRLDLVDGDPTRYHYGDEERALEPTQYSVQVRQADGSLQTETRVLWSSHYGPMLERGGTLPWSMTVAYTYRDANLDNVGLVEQFLGQARARSLDELIAVHERVNGLPWVNTVAAGADGEVWYADTSATPALTDEAIADWEQQRVSDPIVRLADDSGLVLLDGSDPRFEWIDEPGARSPGLIAFDGQPQLRRQDYVFNANDSYWMPHADERLTGFSPLQGGDAQVRIPRSRENARLLSDTSADGPAGSDGRFTLDELAAALFSNRAFTADLLLDDALTRCVDPPTVVLESRQIALGEACSVLADWDRRLDLDSVGAPLWIEFVHALAPTVDELYAMPFDPDDPIGTPSGLLPPPLAGPDPVMVSLAAAVAALDDARVALDAPLGEVQFTIRGEERVPMHGGPEVTGTANIVDFREPIGTRAPRLPRPEVVNESSALVDGGYFVNGGASFILVVALGGVDPVAEAVLTYGQSEDPASGHLIDQTLLFSQKQLRPVLFTEADILADPELVEYAVQGR